MGISNQHTIDSERPVPANSLIKSAKEAFNMVMDLNVKEGVDAARQQVNAW